MGQPKHVIRTSDRIHFKKCRRAWNWSSKLRSNLEPIKPRQALEFGTAIHAALEVFYDPAIWSVDRSIAEAAALTRFTETTKQQVKTYLELSGNTDLDRELQEDFDERAVLGPEMLKGYFRWSEDKDDFTVKDVELEFEIPIPVPQELVDVLPVGFDAIWHPQLKCNVLYFQKAPVVYQGRLDLLVELASGGYAIIDHKTTARMEEDTSFLELDEQCGSYAWALTMVLGIDVRKVIYNQLYKGYPDKPKRNKTQRKGCWFSVSKSQDTSFELYYDTVAQEDAQALAAGYYDEILDYLKNVSKQYYRRIDVPRSHTELRAIGNRICMEAIDMLSSPFIYPNPNKFGCSWCDFRLPCLAADDGSELQFILDGNYNNRDNRPRGANE